jgi:hypothetical protein
MSSLSSKIRCEERRIERFSKPMHLIIFPDDKILLEKSIKRLAKLKEKLNEQI